MRQPSAMGIIKRKGGAGLHLFLQGALWLLLASPGQADFYRYTGKDGVEVFTNTPSGAGAVRVLREQPRRTATSGTPRFPSRDLPLPVRGTITSNYGWRQDPIDGGMRHHNGVDIAVPAGTGVKAIAAGTVIQSAPRGGYGNLVAIDHGDGMISMYGHNERLKVGVGEHVAAGQVVALSGSTGRSTGPHLHFELWKHGVNVTQSYLQTGDGIPEVSGGIRSYLHSDGSLVFTNMN